MRHTSPWVFGLCSFLAGGAALAQSDGDAASVTLYGVADAGVSHTTGLSTGPKAVVSGIMDGSRFGLRGNEPLAAGWRAVFTVEHRLEVDTGAMGSRPPSGSQVPDRLAQLPLLNQVAGTAIPNVPSLQAAVTSLSQQIGSTIGVNLSSNFWDRQAFVGLVTPVGALLLGRQYTPAYELAGTFDVLGTSSALSPGQLATIPAGFDIRINNALQYRLAYRGLTASAMAALGEVSGNDKANDFYGLMAQYRGESFAIGAALNQRNNDVGQKSLRNLVVGASMTMGASALHLLGVQMKDDNPSGVSTISSLLQAGGVPATFAGQIQTAYTNALKQDARLYHLGYKLALGAHTFYTAFNRYDDRRPANADVSSYGVVYTYALSKRTDLNAQAVRYVNADLAQVAPGQVGYVGGVTRSAGTDSNVVAFGVRHKF